MLTRIFFCAFVSLLFVMTTFSQTPPLENGVSQTLAKWRAANYSDVRYKLNLTLEKGAPMLKGTIEVKVNLRQAGKTMKRSGEVGSAFEILDSLPTIILDWRKIKDKENLSNVSNVLLNGKTLTLNPDSRKFNVVVDRQEGETQNYFEFNEHLAFQDGVKIGENIIKLDFTSPIATSGAAITRYVDKEDAAEYVYSLFVPSDASTAFPVFDQPDLKARFTLSVTAPLNWYVISNTNIDTNFKVERNHSPENEIGAKIITFSQTKPISTYVFAFAAGKFARVSSGFQYQSPPNPQLTECEEKIKPSIYVRQSQSHKLDAHEVFRLNCEGVKFLESYFDYKFPFPKYDLVLIPEFPFGGMEHAGATFLREASVIFPTEPTKNDYVSRANVIFHEAAHQWFGDTVTMKWFDDLWLKEGFAEFMAYKTLEKVMPEYNAWKIFYERNKQAAYLTDSTRGTTPIYQEIPNLSAAKSAYGNIVYRKAPSFLKQAEFYLGDDKFQMAVRQFLKKHEFANAEWSDLIEEFETAIETGEQTSFGKKENLKEWADYWVKRRGLPIVKIIRTRSEDKKYFSINVQAENSLEKNIEPRMLFFMYSEESYRESKSTFGWELPSRVPKGVTRIFNSEPYLIFPNYGDYGYGIFLLDEKSRAYVLANIQNEKDDFLRAMMWGSLWDSVRETELAPEDYVKLVIKNLNVETDESTIQTLLGRVSTAMNYYLSDKQREEITPQLEAVLLGGMRNAKTLGQRITFYRAYLNIASSEFSQEILRKFLKNGGKIIELGMSGDSIGGQTPTIEVPPLKTKDKFDIVTKLLILENKKILGNNEAEKLLAELERTETSDEAKRYAYAARAGIATAENKQKFFNDFLNNKEISESYIESAFVPFNSPKHADLALQYLEKALAELPNLKKNRKIFFVNGWLAAFIGGQKSEEALKIVNKFLADNPNLDRDLRLKILENADGLERAVKIRARFGK